MNNTKKGKNLYKIAIVLAFAGAFLALPKAQVLASELLTPRFPDNSNSFTCYACNSNNNSNSGNYLTSNSSNSSNNNSNNNNNSSNNSSGNYVATNNTVYVTTEPAIEIKKTSAVIQGTTYLTEGNASVWFEWGTNASNLNNTTPTVIINQTTSGSSFPLTNLASGTKYFYRIIARTNAGNSYGIVRSFTTTGTSVSGTTTSSNSNSSKNVVTKTSSNSTSYTSNNGDIKGSLSASAVNARSSNNSGSFLPTTVFGWLLIIILVFAIVLTVRKIQIENEARKKREEELKKQQEEMAKMQKLATA